MNPINQYSGLPGTKMQTNTDPLVTANQPTSGVGTTRTAKGPVVAQDHVTLSPAARSLLAAQTSANTERLQGIKTAIANGTYQISPQRIGQGLTQDAQQFLPLATNNKA
ncbi:flagellar biosynthesis anti-sigma factor FlgM [Acidithiobacillus sp.]|uniref:flagellar biosynthesis anti-sigma factor FlgM n=1 Tax=Acidithiobacillus sp. TaxID=1872118 RepID=UPI0025C42D1F|nr:flagellar biosynthesis anti-sigma factor FlgM [Acidithiobacillus sp.]MCK9187581.1 flagellar biosynthesis anti-sigma factor FlgM [Acidithiobacillus sp.]MCK9358471.1 flagellar biosynthesis anti-sigma factor FlgM [Acidithiobacillus sp.]